jgi:hypothetical protein
MGGATPLTLAAISIDPSSVLDVADNGIIVNSGNPTALLVTLSGYLAAGRDGGDWNGLGLRSSAAHLAYVAHGNTEITGLALAWNPLLPVAVAMLNGASVDGSAVVVKYTYAGDADLDGKITIDDYLALEDGFLFQAAGYSAGAFDYHATVDGADFAIIDAAYQAQNQPTAISATAPTLRPISPNPASSPKTSTLPTPTFQPAPSVETPKPVTDNPSNGVLSTTVITASHALAAPPDLLRHLSPVIPPSLARPPTTTASANSFLSGRSSLTNSTPLRPVLFRLQASSPWSQEFIVPAFQPPAPLIIVKSTTGFLHPLKTHGAVALPATVRSHSAMPL